MMVRALRPFACVRPISSRAAFRVSITAGPPATPSSTEASDTTRPSFDSLAMVRIAARSCWGSTLNCVRAATRKRLMSSPVDVTDRAIRICGKYGRVLVDQIEGGTQDWSCGTPVLAQHNQFGSRKLAVKQLKCGTGSSSKVVNRLVGIADGEDISFPASECGEDLDLGKIRVLKLIHQDEACPLALDSE